MVVVEITATVQPSGEPQWDERGAGRPHHRP
jgi:hypothetical protein